MNVFYEVNDEPIVISKATIDRMLKEDDPAEVIGQYLINCYNAKYRQDKAAEGMLENGKTI